MVLCEEKKDCCACGACVNICPKQAISLKSDENGFLFPKIDTQKCIECGLCKNVCDFKKPIGEQEYKAKCYFAVRNDKEQLLESTSGGMFSTLAEHILEQGGIVYGSTLEKKGRDFSVIHVGIVKKEELGRLRGSKYVQSNTGMIYKNVKDDLENGKKVLFCGTPCQVAGLKSYLGKERDNLYTTDLICHGTPSVEMFNSYIHYLEKKNKWKISKVHFRRKQEKIDSTMYFLDVCLENGKEKRIFCKLLSYYGYFLSSDICRESCYHCKYACEKRVGDITLGDAWGVEDVNPEILVENGGIIDKTRGLSSVMVNSYKGNVLLDSIKERVTLSETTFENISKQNHQLIHPTSMSDKRENILRNYREYGYEAVDKLYFNEMGMKQYFKWKYYLPLTNLISKDIKKKIKYLFKR